MTDQTRVFQLERLYVSVTAQNGKAPALQVFGRTPGIKPEQVAECWRSAQMLPPPANQRTDDMPGSLGIFRGESVDYIIAKAQTGPNGLPQMQYLLAPAGAVRALTSNIRLLEGYAKEPIPQYASPRTDLPPFTFDPPEPPDAEAQTDDLNALIQYCKNDLKVVGELLAGLVEAMGLGIINAPTSLHERMTFVQGILTLLPSPVRVAITFATSVTDPAQTKAQIKFLTSDVRPENHLIFDWATGKLLNDAPEDVYAKYIMTQLRLDTSLVLEQTDKLARTAVWRAMRKDDMANALAWVSRRATLDTLILEGLAADRVMVAGVLREDPTLPDDLRIAYTRHLLSVALALDDATYTEIIPAMAAQKPDLAQSSFDQLKAATEGKSPMAVYHLVERWVMQPPMGVDVSRWRPLLSLAIVAQNELLLAGNETELVQFLESFFHAPPILQLEATIARIIGVSRKRAAESPDVARAIFLLAVTYLPAGGLQRLLGENSLVAQLPEPLRAVFPHLVSPRQTAAPRQLLVKAAEVFGQDYQWVILARLVEWALYLQRFDLMDYDVLRGMVRLAASPQGARFDSISQHVIEALTQPDLIRTLDPKAPYYLAQLSMASGRYDEAIRQLEIYQQTLFKGTDQEDMAEVTRAVFRELPLKPEAINAALEAMQDSQLKTIARANGYIGALEGKDWSPQLDVAARKLTAILFADPRMTALIGTEPVLRLLKANADRRDAMEAIKLASAMVEYALTLAVSQGPALIQQVYPLVNWSPEVSDAALEILRTYLRRAPIDLAQDLPNIMGRQYGESVRQALDVTYRMRLILGGTDFLAFAEQILLSSQLLTDMALTYYDTSEIPPMHRVRRTVEAMPGGISETERDRLSWNLNMLGQQLLRLAQAANRRKPRSEKEAEARNDQLVKGQVVPDTSIDALTWLGGHFSGGKAAKLQLNREAPSYMFGSRSVNTLLRETDLVVSLLDALLLAFPEKSAFAIDLKMWTAEIDALWGLLSLFKQRQIQSIMAEHPQLLGQVIRVLGSKGNEKIFQSSGYGRQLQAGRAQPQNVIEALRWISGYFGYLHS